MTHLISWTICNENSLVNLGTKSHISPSTLGNGEQASLFSSERASGAIVASFSLESIRYLGRSSSYLTDGKQNKIIWQNSRANDGVFDLISNQFRFVCFNVFKMLQLLFVKICQHVVEFCQIVSIVCWVFVNIYPTLCQIYQKICQVCQKHVKFVKQYVNCVKKNISNLSKFIQNYVKFVKNMSNLSKTYVGFVKLCSLLKSANPHLRPCLWGSDPHMAPVCGVHGPARNWQYHGGEGGG